MNIFEGLKNLIGGLFSFDLEINYISIAITLELLFICIYMVKIYILLGGS